MGELRTFPTPALISRKDKPSNKGLMSVGANVHALIDRRMPKIRITNPDALGIQARGFFQALNQGLLSGDSALVMVVSLRDDRCRLEISSHGGTIYTITGESYIELTEPERSESLVDYTGYLVERLEDMGSRVSFRYTDKEHILDDTEIGNYFPESIPGRGIGQFSCELYRNRYNPEGSASAHSLDRDNITLLDIIFAAIYDAQYSGYSYEGMALDIIYVQENIVTMKTIPAGRVEYLIYAALMRINPLYKNFGYENAVNSYLDKYIRKYFK